MEPTFKRHEHTADETEALGQRERSKRDKRRRLREAARKVFIEKGFDAATTREIAVEADVSVGTVFVYARDKRDLLLMIVNDELDAVTEQCQAAWVERPGPLLDRLCGFFGERYRYWASEPALARPVLQQTSELVGDVPGSLDVGEQMHRFHARRGVVLTQLSTIVLQAQAAGEAAPDLDATHVASLFMTLYVADVRRWLHKPDPKPAAGLKHLRDLFSLVIRGVRP
ncbi:MAG TPA: TetR/AcrR family transcriptional regulator [Ramlibacter sp.]|nr:TetR/AcrR family transcriptional regulator [Ramlibacter sp.]